MKVESRYLEFQPSGFMLHFEGGVLNSQMTATAAESCDENFAELHTAVVNGGLGVGDWLDDVWTLLAPLVAQATDPRKRRWRQIRGRLCQSKWILACHGQTWEISFPNFTESREGTLWISSPRSHL